MSSKQKLTILDVIVRNGISQRTGKPYTMRTAQCVLEQSTTEGPQIVVGTITLPEAMKDHGKGEYLAEFALTQSREGELVPRIVSLQTYVTRPANKPAT